MKRYAEKGYQGWKNYETWNAALWMGNDSGSYDYWNETAEEIREDIAEYGPESEYWSDEEALRYQLADRMKDHFEEGNPLSGSADVYSDLMSAALSEVDWNEIAANWLSD